MCIIVIKPKNKIIQPKETLQECFKSCSDGAGYMFTNNDKTVIIKKGLMTFDTFYESMMKDYKDYNLIEKNLVMHFRITTSGTNKEGGTHPFAITDNYDQLELLHVKTNMGVCHNGIIAKYTDYKTRYSDTQNYIAQVITPLIRLNINAYKFADIQAIILKTTNSKWAILNRADEIYTIGEFINDDDYLYSNTMYKKITYTYNTYNYDTSVNDDDDDDDDDNKLPAWYHRTYNKQEKTNTVTTYKMLQKGNILFANEIKYLVIKDNNEYWFDNKYSIFTKDKSAMKKVGNNAVIYTDETFTQRRDFNNDI